MTNDYLQLQLRKEAVSQRLELLCGQGSIPARGGFEPVDRAWVQQRLSALQETRQASHVRPASAPVPTGLLNQTASTFAAQAEHREYLRRQALLLEKEAMENYKNAYSNSVGIPSYSTFPAPLVQPSAVPFRSLCDPLPSREDSISNRREKERWSRYLEEKQLQERDCAVANALSDRAKQLEKDEREWAAYQAKRARRDETELRNWNQMVEEAAAKRRKDKEDKDKAFAKLVRDQLQQSLDRQKICELEEAQKRQERMLFLQREMIDERARSEEKVAQQHRLQREAHTAKQIQEEAVAERQYRESQEVARFERAREEKARHDFEVEQSRRRREERQKQQRAREQEEWEVKRAHLALSAGVSLGEIGWQANAGGLGDDCGFGTLEVQLAKRAQDNKLFKQNLEEMRVHEARRRVEMEKERVAAAQIEREKLQEEAEDRARAEKAIKEDYGNKWEQFAVVHLSPSKSTAASQSAASITSVATSSSTTFTSKRNPVNDFRVDIETELQNSRLELQRLMEEQENAEQKSAQPYEATPLEDHPSVKSEFADESDHKYSTPSLPLTRTPSIPESATTDHDFALKLEPSRAEQIIAKSREATPAKSSPLVDSGRETEKIGVGRELRRDANGLFTPRSLSFKVATEAVEEKGKRDKQKLSVEHGKTTKKVDFGLLSMGESLDADEETSYGTSMDLDGMLGLGGSKVETVPRNKPQPLDLANNLQNEAKQLPMTEMQKKEKNIEVQSSGVEETFEDMIARNEAAQLQAEKERADRLREQDKEKERKALQARQEAARLLEQEENAMQEEKVTLTSGKELSREEKQIRDHSSGLGAAKATDRSASSSSQHKSFQSSPSSKRSSTNNSLSSAANNSQHSSSSNRSQQSAKSGSTSPPPPPKATRKPTATSSSKKSKPLDDVDDFYGDNISNSSKTSPDKQNQSENRAKSVANAPLSSAMLLKKKPRRRPMFGGGLAALGGGVGFDSGLGGFGQLGRLKPAAEDSYDNEDDGALVTGPGSKLSKTINSPSSRTGGDDSLSMDFL